jgi:bile acid:Na+ symporter, BASS family
MLGTILQLSLVVFMAGSLLATGLEIAVADAVRALGDRRFVGVAIVWAFVVCPALAWATVRVIPIEEGYAAGLLLMGLTPCAPFAPLMARRAGGDLAAMAALLLVTALGTVVVMPVLVPVLVEGLVADPWIIAKPLLLFVLAPLCAGMAVRHAAAAAAERLLPIVRITTTVATIAMLGAMAALHGRAMLGAVGSGAIGVQVLYLGMVIVVSYGTRMGLRQNQRSVLALSLGTRNFGAALVPLMAVPGADPRATVMIALGVPVTLVLSAVAARWFGRDAAREQRTAIG